MSALRCRSCGYDNPPEARFCANCGSNLATAAKPPESAVVPGAESSAPAAVEYMGFWIRFGAALIDGIIIFLVSFVFSRFMGLGIASPFLMIFIPWLYYWLFIGLKGQTPGKMALGIKVVNASGSIPGLGRAALREIPGKIISFVVIYIGFLWIIWDRQKQGWHDKIAQTYVVRAAAKR
jgi:uncharacterized RDD family membrane protein YckC